MLIRCSRNTLTHTFLGILIIAMYAGVRLLDLDRLVTTDEPFWLGASANFYRALRTGQLAYTYQLEHPGVLTTWAGAAAFWLRIPDYANLIDHNLDGFGGMYTIEPVLRGIGKDPLPVMVTAKIIKVLVQTAFFAVALFFLRKSTNAAIAYTTGGLLAFSPFLTGLDSALHVDGMAAITTFAAFCAIVYASEQTRLMIMERKVTLYWVVAGLLCATAWLSRYPAILLFGIVGLGLLLQTIAQREIVPIATRLRSSLAYGIIWFASGVISTFMLWPALWTAPGATLTGMWEYSREAAGQGYENPLIFMGVVKRGDPGWLFYPVSILWRASVIDVAGIAALFLLGVWAWRRGYITSTLLRISVMALTYMVVFVITQSFGAKKFDRYISPIYPLITLLASIGLLILGQWLVNLLENRRFYLTPTLVAVAVNIVFIGCILPYRLDYFSPVMGGPKAAVTNMQMGWGQGGDQVVAFLNQQSTTAPITVQSSAVPSAFTYFLPDDSLIHFAGFGLDTPGGWYETDFFVAGIQQTQRHLSTAYPLFADVEPIHTVYIGGVPYFQTFSVRTAPLPESLRQTTACNYSFGNTITLMQIIGRDQTVDFYFLSGPDEMDQETELGVDFISPTGERVETRTILSMTPSGTMTRASVANPAAGSDTQLSGWSIDIVALRGDQPLPVTAPWQARQADIAVTQSECYYTAPPNAP